MGANSKKYIKDFQTLLANYAVAPLSRYSVSELKTIKDNIQIIRIGRQEFHLPIAA